MDDEAGHEDPRPEVVGRVEVEPEQVVVLDVEDAGRHLEDDAADDHHQRQPLQEVGDRPEWRPGEQLGHDRPQLGQHDGHQDQAERDVQPFGQLEEPGRAGGPVEDRQMEEADVARDRLVETGTVGDPVEQSGEGHERQGDEQQEAEDRCQPRPP